MNTQVRTVAPGHVPVPKGCLSDVATTQPTALRSTWSQQLNLPSDLVHTPRWYFSRNFAFCFMDSGSTEMKGEGGGGGGEGVLLLMFLTNTQEGMALIVWNVLKSISNTSWKPDFACLQQTWEAMGVKQSDEMCPQTPLQHTMIVRFCASSSGVTSDSTELSEIPLKSLS